MNKHDHAFISPPIVPSLFITQFQFFLFFCTKTKRKNVIFVSFSSFVGKNRFAPLSWALGRALRAAVSFLARYVYIYRYISI